MTTTRPNACRCAMAGARMRRAAAAHGWSEEIGDYSLIFEKDGFTVIVDCWWNGESHGPIYEARISQGTGVPEWLASLYQRDKYKADTVVGWLADPEVSVR